MQAATLKTEKKKKKKKKNKNTALLWGYKRNTNAPTQAQVNACSDAGGVLLTPGERRRESG